MTTTKTIAATGFVLVVLGLLGWGLVWGVGYLQGVLAPIDPTTMSLVIAGWIGLWGAALIVALAVRTARAGADRAQRRGATAETYAYLLDAWAHANLLQSDPLPDPVPQTAEEADLQADVVASLHQAERRLALHGSPGVVRAYTEAWESGRPFGDAVTDVVSEMRRDLGHTTFGVDASDLLAHRPRRPAVESAPASGLSGAGESPHTRRVRAGGAA